MSPARNLRVQVKLRADRMGINGQGILLLAETDVDVVLERLDEAQPSFAIIDSIQTLQTESESSGPGSVGQVRESALRLLRWAKSAGTPVFISGHMTKDGALAGPRVLEHMVDVVLHLESQDSGSYRVLRAAKEPFRLHRRGWRIRNDWARPRRCAGPVPDCKVPECRPAARRHRHPSAGGQSRLAARGCRP